MGYFPWSYPRPQMRFGKVASFSGSYGFVPMKWVPQLNDIRISLPEFRGRSPTLILMLYVNELYVYCPSQSSVQDLYAGIIQLYPKINLEREIGFPVFFFGCRMPKSYSVSTWIWFIHHSLASRSRRLEILGFFPPSSPWGSVFVCFCFPPIGVTCPGPGSWVISHDLTPDLI